MRVTPPQTTADTFAGVVAPARILLVEDEQDIAALIKHTLERAGDGSVEIVGRGDEAIRSISSRQPDLVILDLNIPVLSGEEVCRLLRQKAETRQLPIIMLTARTSESERVAGLDLGADDYVRKPFSVRELLARVRAQVRRDDWHSAASEEFSFGDVTVRLRQRLVLRGGQRVPLSAREFELLRYLIAHRGEVVSRAQLLRDVWGYHQLAVTRTVDNYVAKLRTQLEPEPHDPRYIVTVHGSGYQLLPWPGVAGPN